MHRYKHREERTHRSRSDPSKDSHAHEKSHSYKPDRSSGRRHESCHSRNNKSTSGHHRSDRSASPSLDNSHKRTSYDDEKGRCRESRKDDPKKSTPASESVAGHSSKDGYNRDHRRHKLSDRHVRNLETKDVKKSSSSHVPERSSNSSRDKKGERLPKDHQRKEDRRQEESSRKYKNSTSLDTRRQSVDEVSKESHQGKFVECRGERKEKAREPMKTLCGDPSITKKSSVEEDSPKRKLCFMETLNLTISPVKRPASGSNACQNGAEENVEAFQRQQDLDESCQPIMEDMCVVDEVNCSGLELEQDNDMAKFPDTTKILKSENKEQCKSVNEARRREGSCSEPGQDQPVQATSVNGRAIDASQTQGDVLIKSKSPVNIKPTGADILRMCVDKTNVVLEKKSDKLEPVQVHCVAKSPSKGSKSNTVPRAKLVNVAEQAIALSKPTKVAVSVAQERTQLGKVVPKSCPTRSEKERKAAGSVGGKEGLKNHPANVEITPPESHSGRCTSASSPTKDKDVDAVSSTICLDLLPQEGLSLPEAIYILTQTSEEANDGCQQSPSVGSVAVPKVSSTTSEEAVAPQELDDPTFTPKKCSVSVSGKAHGSHFETPNPLALLHDEDSMMRTLSGLKRIPDAISPLRSPIQLSKRSQHHSVHTKPGHVKSLERDFTGSLGDGNSKKLDVNKENKYPGSPANHDLQILADKGSDLHSSLSDTDLEEGEILSESEETVPNSPDPPTKKAKLGQPVKNKPSPRRLLSRTSKEKCAPGKVTAEASDGSSQSPKSRFKKVCPAASKSNFVTTADVMETFKQVRIEIRKKYMKLHKTFPKKSFYGVMNNFRESFLEFVDSANFGQLSCQQGELKSKIKKLIVTVFSKLSNNGIVKRIFEQQAGDLKQKLWDFVDGQIDYLLRDIDTTLKGLGKPVNPQSDEKTSKEIEKVSPQPPVTKLQCHPKESESVFSNSIRTRQCATVAPYKTGLGSRGKDIRITFADKDKDSHSANTITAQTTVGFHNSKDTLSVSDNQDKSSGSQNGSLLDKTDFELLTEQQASSLTFNLVRDTQMGEIFKCLLQGSDLLEANSTNGDNVAWSFGTPRKDRDPFVNVGTPTKFDSPSKLFSPCKFDTPSKVIAAWSSITPQKMSSPQSKSQVPLNPAFFDESCLLEVPSDSRTSASQRSFSILAEDLAVSLTIPSPLKSDSHLSFLQPSSVRSMPTPDSVISAHISEDALLDEEDATEQDIHLALDTDNSSRGSGSSGGSSSSSALPKPQATPFVFKPHLPMQALVMERSNDHFIVKIRQASASADPTPAADNLNTTLSNEDGRNSGGCETTREHSVLAEESHGTSTNLALPEREMAVPPASSKKCNVPTSEFDLLKSGTSPWIKEAAHKESTGQSSPNASLSVNSQEVSISLKSPEIDKVVSGDHVSEKSSIHKSNTTVGPNIPLEPNACQVSKSENASTSPKVDFTRSSCGTSSQLQVSASSDSEKQQTSGSGSEKGSSGATSGLSGTSESEPPERSESGKRKRRHEKKMKAKRRRKEINRSAEMDEEKNAETEGSNCRSDGECKSTPTSPSSSGLSAKNVVKKKGEVVVSWTRDEDRDILVALKTKGASRETFSTLSEKLNKPSGQIAHRFYQLMKLYKKQGKMET